MFPVHTPPPYLTDVIVCERDRDRERKGIFSLGYDFVKQKNVLEFSLWRFYFLSYVPILFPRMFSVLFTALSPNWNST